MVTEISDIVLSRKDLLSSFKKARRKFETQKEKFEQAEKEKKISGTAMADFVRKRISTSFNDKTIERFLSLPVQNIEGEKPKPQGTIFSNIFGISFWDGTKIAFGDYFGFGTSACFHVKPVDIRKAGFTPTEKGLRKILSKIALASNHKIIIQFREVRNVEYWGTPMGTLVFFDGICKIKEEVLLKK